MPRFRLVVAVFLDDARAGHWARTTCRSLAVWASAGLLAIGGGLGTDECWQAVLFPLRWFLRRQLSNLRLYIPRLSVCFAQGPVDDASSDLVSLFVVVSFCRSFDFSFGKRI